MSDDANKVAAPFVPVLTISAARTRMKDYPWEAVVVGYWDSPGYFYGDSLAIVMQSIALKMMERPGVHHE